MNNEQIRDIKVYSEPSQASVYVAQRIATIIKQKQELGLQTVLGLATGGTPKGVYRELIHLHRNEGLSFRNVVTFNLDEYYPMNPLDGQSYVAFMNQNLFDHIDILKENIHIPDGTLSRETLKEYCLEYEQKIRDFGGLDLQLLGIGRTGHIGFNEPGSLEDSITRLVTLNELTRTDAIDDFGGIDNVPVEAITMGVQTITQAKEIILMAWKQKKAEIIQKAIEEPITKEIPASYLQKLNNVEYVLDHEAASLLKVII